MKLDERAWVYSAGLGADWKKLRRLRNERTLRELQAVSREFARRAPAGVRRTKLIEGLRCFLRARGPARDSCLRHPALDYWLFLWDKHFSAPGPEENWRLQFGLFSSFSAGVALDSGRRTELDAVLDADAHLHLYGSALCVEFPAALSHASVRLRVGPDELSVQGPDGARWRLPRRLLDQGGVVEGVSVRRELPVAAGLTASACGFLLTDGVVMHGLAKPTAAEMAAFAGPLAQALSHIGSRAPALFDEMTDLVRVLVPLTSPEKHGSVSSSYVNLRGAICLSPSEDTLLQAETLIHEFCHQKMNLLLLTDEILKPGQSGQVFYSPWRPDARRLRGLLLGAHAFLNVASYLIRSLSCERYPTREGISVMCNVARRLWEVEAALSAVCGYAELGEFGARFVLGMRRELQLLFHAVQWYPREILEEARRDIEAHRSKYSLPGTGFHKSADFAAVVDMGEYRKPEEPAA